MALVVQCFDCTQELQFVLWVQTIAAFYFQSTCTTFDEVLEAECSLAYKLINGGGAHFSCAVENTSTGCSDLFIAGSLESKIEFFFPCSGIYEMTVRIYERREYVSVRAIAGRQLILRAMGHWSEIRDLTVGDGEIGVFEGGEVAQIGPA